MQLKIPSDVRPCKNGLDHGRNTRYPGISLHLAGKTRVSVIRRQVLRLGSFGAIDSNQMAHCLGETTRKHNADHLLFHQQTLSNKKRSALGVIFVSFTSLAATEEKASLIVRVCRLLVLIFHRAGWKPYSLGKFQNRKFFLNFSLFFFARFYQQSTGFSFCQLFVVISEGLAWFPFCHVQNVYFFTDSSSCILCKEKLCKTLQMKSKHLPCTFQRRFCC